MNKISGQRIFIISHIDDNEVRGILLKHLNDNAIEIPTDISYDLRMKSEYSRDAIYEMFDNKEVIVLIFIISKSSVADPFIIDQVLRAKKYNKIILGFKIEDCDISSIIPSIQYIDSTTNQEYAIKELIQILQTIFNSNSQEENLDLGALQIGKVTFRIGSLFDDDFLNRSGVLLVPASVQGTVSNNFYKEVERFNMLPVPESPLGSIIFFDRQTNSRNIILGYAYSVDAGESNYDAIADICTRITDAFKNKLSGFIHVPLFATGAGNLDPVNIASLYLNHFNKEQ